MQQLLSLNVPMQRVLKSAARRRRPFLYNSSAHSSTSYSFFPVTTIVFYAKLIVTTDYNLCSHYSTQRCTLHQLFPAIFVYKYLPTRPQIILNTDPHLLFSIYIILPPLFSPLLSCPHCNKDINSQKLSGIIAFRRAVLNNNFSSQSKQAD